MSDDTKPIPPGTFGLPVVGETAAFASDIYGFIDDRLAEHGLVFRTRVAGRKMAVIAGPEAAAAFVDPENCSRVGSLPPNLRPLFGGVAVNGMDGEPHADVKRPLMAALNREALAFYLPAIEESVAAQLAEWASQGEQSLIPGARRVSVAALARTVLGHTPADGGAALAERYHIISSGFGAVPIPLPFTQYGGALEEVNESIAMMRELAEERVLAPGDDGLSRILAARNPDGSQLEPADVAREAHHLMVAAFIVFAELVGIVRVLKLHPEFVHELRAEIDAHAQGALTPAVLAAMPLLRQFCLEVKRVTPVVPVAFGIAKRTFELHGYRIPKGWTLVHALTASVWKHGVFDAPEKFDPQRFSPERAEDQRAEYTLVVQGAGEYFGRGHLCAGVDFSTLLMQVFAVHLLRDYECTAPDQDLSWRLSGVPVPRSRMIATITPRA